MSKTLLKASLAISETAARADTLLCEQQQLIWKRTDRLLTGLLAFEWILAIILALWRSPYTWRGNVSSIHPHVYAAVVLGSAILAGPALLTLSQPGRLLTRHTIAIGQMAMSGLLIDVGGGQIEMHFQIFGALAFLAFYRDWRVLITASVVTASDHLFRGIFATRSIYGLDHASLWLTAEHVGWVLFENVFLIGSCVRGEREMRGIAVNQALLEHSYHDVERQVEERTEELKATQGDLMKAARFAGMAEIATSVLHNVGNVLNSVNISATIVAEKLKGSELPSLGKISDMIVAHKGDLPEFLSSDQRGKLVPDFLIELAACLGDEQRHMMSEVENLSKGIDHIKQIVAAQQSMAKSSTVHREIQPVSLMETAIEMQGAGGSAGVELQKRFADLPPLMLDQHKVLQILINLITNALHAVTVRPAGQRLVTLGVSVVPTLAGDRLRYQVTDNGMGIAPENLNRVFSHGFTTKKDGHGFGLHSAANAAGEMGGSLNAASDGVDRGATFTLELPAEPVKEEQPCKV